MSSTGDHGPFTRAIHAGLDPFDWMGAVSTPIFQASTFAFESTDQGAARFRGEEDGYIYTRLGNPTTDALQRAVAELEGGAAALATSSGMAAVSAVYFAFLSPGDHAVASSALYGPSRVILEREFTRFGVEPTFVDTADADAFAEAVRPDTRLVYVETPANPTIKVTDLALASRLAKESGALLVVDNTFMSPYLQRPFEFGADVVLHSMTKFLNGHADVVAGMLVTRDPELHRRLSFIVKNLGGTIDPHQAWLVHRGLRTLPLRIEKAQENAQAIAEYLTGHEKVEWVAYPGLPDHPGHHLLGTQMDGPGALLSFGVQGGIEGGKTVLNSVKVMILAVSLGGIETLIQHPASMTHASMTPEGRAQAEITDGLVRISVGCEDLEDLRADLEQALAKV
jgi:methionine-gamma-lyase